MMQLASARPAPAVPPTHFHLSEELPSGSRWGAVPFGAPFEPMTLFPGARSSSDDPLSLQMIEQWLRPELILSSSVGLRVVVERVDLQRRDAEVREATVSRSAGSQNVFELRRLTGLTWERLGELLNVDRRTIHNWAGGSRIRQANLDHVAAVLRILRYVDRGSAEANKDALDTPVRGVTAFDALRRGMYDDVRAVVGHGQGRAGTDQGARRISGFDPGPPEMAGMMLHEEATGHEVVTDLPFEPEPSSRKRRRTRR